MLFTETAGRASKPIHPSHSPCPTQLPFAPHEGVKRNQLRQGTCLRRPASNRSKARLTTSAMTRYLQAPRVYRHRPWPSLLDESVCRAEGRRMMFPSCLGLPGRLLQARLLRTPKRKICPPLLGYSNRR
ncbi:uncharacterized protein BO96DRAFT_134836 [Aspergillus niger CBS 101883]|uniref:Uncharacterized protein n=3 Tax=Aspergillus niger TaxID=5061 RepID=A2QHM9_ASPNC|nr:uncharacterized protein BO96DRAFT_134836 [Aspergillus niger CBS 101883]XP_059600427.1 hypothetical protein An04g00433 [Aspergillus niger]PYH53142.1 hypothetical protein BO96DRAFT_134836 [Aspergillus niger CBS 101883]RDH21118.1 hypothetical protein M747DRAFT_30295 [Aspergillus niger ATCC 13496]CAK38499.1 hypothetical protein An04g00433 [Aspergillus niger]